MRSNLPGGGGKLWDTGILPAPSHSPQTVLTFPLDQAGAAASAADSEVPFPENNSKQRGSLGTRSKMGLACCTVCFPCFALCLCWGCRETCPSQYS